ncbi:MAG: PAS domain S-box protein [Bryobacteraceae bacterium]|nr:PAS domain S-box protein [Bryobacteraceae bacterium]
MSDPGTRFAAVVVNGDPALLDTLTGLLSDAGIETSAFDSAEAALAAMDLTRPPGLVVTGLDMPGIDGLQLCRLLRSPGFTAFNETPILVVSSTLAGDHSGQIAAGAGATAFLSSPFDAEEVKLHALALLQGRKAHHPPRLLIVVEDEQIASLLRKDFAIQGYLTESAHTIGEARAALANSPFDLAVLDHPLPGGLATSLLDEFRSTRPDCACLVMTSDPSPALAIDCMKRGAAAILHKPFETPTLLQLCARVRRERALLRFEDVLEARTRALRESEKRFRTLVENSPGVTYLCLNDQRYSMLFISEQIRQLTGYDRSAFLAGEVSLTDLYHPDDLPGIRAAVDDAVARNSPFHLSYRLLHRDGSLRWLEEWGAVLATPSGVLLEGFMADVTEQTRSREAVLFQSQILDSVSEAVVATDLQGRILYWGRGAETQYGYPASEAIGRNYYDLAGAVDPADPGEFRQMVFDQGSWTGELLLRRRDGSLFWSSVFVSVLRDTAGRPAGLISLVHDITARKNAEQERETLRETAEALSSVFLDLGPGTRQNIDRIVRAACELTGGAAALYNRLDEARSSLEVWNGHHLPPDMPRQDAAHGHICHEATILGRDQTVVLSQLAGTPYELTDPAVRKYGLKSYLGHPVQLRGRTVGSLAVVDTKPRTFSQAEIGAIQLLARALSLEEERHLVESELRQSEARNRALVSAIPDLMFVISKDGYFLDCHTNRPDSLAHPPHEFLNKHVSEVLPPEMAANTLASIGKFFQSQEPQIYEYQIETGGGSGHFEARIVMASGDSAMIISRDITAQKLAESAERRERTDRDLIGRLASEAFQSRDRSRFQRLLLARLGETIDVSRAYIFTFNHTSKTIDNTAEWTAPGVIPQIDNLQGLPASLGEWWISTLMNCGEICCSDVRQIPDEELRELLRLQGILSVLVVPLFIGARFCGFLGLDECRRHREWTARESNLLAEATRILMGLWADEDLRQSEERFKGILQNVATVAVQGYSLDGTVRYWNRASESFYGYSAGEAIGRNLLDLIIPPDLRNDVAAAMRSMAATGVAQPASELNLMRRDGSLIPVYSSHALVRVPGRDVELFCIDVDLTSLKQAEEQREILQTQLVQAQKMESIGRLAGGVAHDFNNMLTVILGQAELALRTIPTEDQLHADIEQIRKAAQRSADLTRQLLAFARKQTVTPRVLDLNTTVEGMIQLLRRLIGENIELLWLPGPQLWPVFLDPSQVDQILTNLCVNARDAISGVGRITIRTANAAVDQNHRPRHSGVVPGDYVLLAIADDGCGMDAETLSHLFEPFFTTKEVGYGTGLGLSTVYGAVTQNHGFIEVDSQPDQGATFRIYFPRHAASTAETVESRPAAETRGKETILVVEDEPAILTMTTMMLQMLGYSTLAALSPAEAIRLAHEHSGPIHLLLTDVIMPEMNGRDLAHHLLSIRPQLRRIFMSGYTANVIANHDIPDEGAHFIQKPFSMSGLGAKIREALQD